MTLLLDTHVLLWWLDDPQFLSNAARDAIADGKNTVYISAAVAWEIAIKRSLGKLDAPDDLEAAMAVNRFLPLPVTIPHALAVHELPNHHRDPFDRLLIAQARHEGFRLASRDPAHPTLRRAPYRRLMRTTANDASRRRAGRLKSDKILSATRPFSCKTKL